MRFITGIVVAGLFFSGAASSAQETPYIKDVSLTSVPSTDESVPLQRRTVTGTLVNPHPTPLTAWALDLVDSDGRPVSREIVHNRGVMMRIPDQLRTDVWSILAVAGAIGAGRSLQSQLFGVQATDPATLMVVTAGAIATALVATRQPARQAARVDPKVLSKN